MKVCNWRLRLELNEWLDSFSSVLEAAEELNEKPRTVYSWYRAEKVPRLQSAARIIQASGGVVDYNGIYAPIARHRLASVERVIRHKNTLE